MYINAKRLGYSTYNIEEYLYLFEKLKPNSITIPRGVRGPLLILLSELEIEYEIEESRNMVEHIEFKTAISYRPYQTKYIRRLIPHDEGVLVAPAGSGKTVLGISLISITGQPTLWLTHTKQLLYQFIDRIKAFIPDIPEVGIIGDGKWDLKMPITVGLVQTLARRQEETKKLYNKFGMIIVDEAHHVPSTTFSTIVSMLNPRYLYGLTATPYRGDKMEVLLFRYIGPIRASIPYDEVINDGGIMKPKVLCRVIKSEPVEGNNTQKILTVLIDNKQRNALITKDVVAEAKNNNYCMVLSDRKAHCEILYKNIKKLWDKTVIVTGDYNDKHNNKQLDLLNNKEATVIVTTFKKLGEGFDVDFLNRAFSTLSFRSKTKVEQMIGRIQRVGDGKTEAILYDYIDKDIGVLYSQFNSRALESRKKTYMELGLKVEYS